MADNVNHPSHYETGKFECIDVMLETQGVEAVKNFCICNAFKYLYRHNGKNGMEDIQKAIWYLNKYVELSDTAEDTCEPENIIIHSNVMNGLPKQSGRYPIEGYTYDDSLDFKPAKNAKVLVEGDWILADDMKNELRYDDQTCIIDIPEGKVLQTQLLNGITLNWNSGTEIKMSKMVQHTSPQIVRTQIMTVDDRTYNVIMARYIDAPESCEGGE